LQYGYLADYVESIQAVLDDGSVVEFTNNFKLVDGQGKAAKIAKNCYDLLSGAQEVISKSLPRTKRNRSGYNISGICHHGMIDMAKLLAGSEGTLAIFTKITLRTVKIPAAKAVLQLEFDSLEKMAKAVPAIVDSGASACELMDRTLVDMAREAYPEYCDILPAGAFVALFVEHTGDSMQDVTAKIERTDSAVAALAVYRKIIYDPAEQKRLSKSRKDAVPLLNRKKGSSHPIPFIEDVSVDNTRLAEYVVGLEKIGEKYGVDMSYYGHAGDGELHVRPYLDLGVPEGVEKMLSIANEVFALAWSLGGSISGEHAEGLVRAAFVRKQYGDEFYELLRKIKKIFDPADLMNPGKIINSDPDIMIRNLRAERKFLGERLESEMLFGRDELRFELEQCNGCGVCLSRETDMRLCPVYRAMGDELGSSRAKVNILNMWMTGDIDEKQFSSKDFRKFLDLCVNCKACSLQCPSGVDISKLMAAARAEFVKRNRLRRTEFALIHNRFVSIVGGFFSPLSNFAMRIGLFRWLLEKVAGIDSRRAIPAFKRGSFLKVGRKYLAAQKPVEKPVDKVAYFVDTFANYNDHELGFAVLKVLRYNDIAVILPDQLPAPLPAIVYGDVRTAKKDLAYSVRHLAGAVRDGYRIVCSEPSAALCLKDELRHFLDNEDAELVSKNTYELMEYLLSLYEQGKLKRPANCRAKDYVYHCPCHLFAIGGGNASIKLLDRLCGLKVKDLKAGCCGLAGTFGMQNKNYDLSAEISKSLKMALEKSPTKNVLTECAVCAMQIEHISSAKVEHPVKVLLEAYGIEGDKKNEAEKGSV
ncbi:MAG: anaerobic glycerol-3-phosphate dehydrogenase subunit C, partial [Candidatus Brocadiia bacterium]